MDKAINFKIDAELYKRIKIKAVINNITLKQYILNLITADLENESEKSDLKNLRLVEK